MVLVDPEQRRRGIGTLLLNHCISSLKARAIPAIKLDATPQGKLVYDKLGFVDEYPIERWEGIARPLGAISAASKMKIESPNCADLAAYDTPIFGADRSKVLHAWLRAWPERALAAYSPAGKMAGYALARRGANFVQVGPLLADTPEFGAMILDGMFKQLAGEKVIVDVSARNQWALGIVRLCGLKLQR